MANTGVRLKLETEIRESLAAYVRRATETIWPETTAEEQEILDRFGQYLCSEAAPELAQETYRVMNIPTSTRRIKALLQSNGVKLQDKSIEVKMVIDFSDQNILDVCALRGQEVELCSMQQEFEGVDFGRAQMKIEFREPAPAPAPEAAPEIQDGLVDVDPGDDAQPRLYHVSDPDGVLRTTEPLSWVDADALRSALLAECGGAEADGWSLIEAGQDDEDFPGDQDEDFPTDAPTDAPEIVLDEAGDGEAPGEEVVEREYVPEPDADAPATEEQPLNAETGFTAQQDLAIACLSGGGTDDDAAKAANVSVLTIKRWRKNVTGFAEATKVAAANE